MIFHLHPFTARALTSVKFILLLPSLLELKDNRTTDMSTIIKKLRNISRNRHCVKSVQIWSLFWSEYTKIRTTKNSVFGYFSRSETFLFFFYNNVFTKINTTKKYIKQCPDSNSVNCRGKRIMLTKK